MARRVPTHGDAVDVESDIHPTKIGISAVYLITQP